MQNLDFTVARITPNRADDVEHVEVTGMDFVAIPVRRLRRSIEFYRRVFGYRVIEDMHERGRWSVLMSAGDRLYLAVEEHDGASDLPLSRWSFVVDDLDRVREHVWNLGVPTADGSDQPRRTRRWRNSRSFVVHDPDGHEIELVERFQVAALV